MVGTDATPIRMPSLPVSSIAMSRKSANYLANFHCNVCGFFFHRGLPISRHEKHHNRFGLTKYLHFIVLGGQNSSFDSNVRLHELSFRVSTRYLVNYYGHVTANVGFYDFQYNYDYNTSLRCTYLMTRYDVLLENYNAIIHVRYCVFPSRSQTTVRQTRFCATRRYAAVSVYSVH